LSGDASTLKSSKASIAWRAQRLQSMMSVARQYLVMHQLALYFNNKAFEKYRRPPMDSECPPGKPVAA